MTAPSAKVRKVMLARDGGRCIVCGRQTDLEAQHRAAVGMGGSKAVPLIYELLTLCAEHNARAEGDLQRRALACGWKVRRWVADQSLVPVYVVWARTWFRLTREGLRVPVGDADAAVMMRSVYGDEWDEEMAA